MNSNQNINKNLNSSEKQKTSSSSESITEINKISNNQIYQKITDLIIEQLKVGHIAWENPLIRGIRPQNLLTGHIYRGANIFTLSLSDTPYFLTFKQINDVGASLKKGSKSYPVIYWNIYFKKAKLEDFSDLDKYKDEELKELLECGQLKYILKYYNVFKITDIENIPEKYLKTIESKDNREISTCENIVKSYPAAPVIENRNSTPAYSPSNDVVYIPEMKFFKSENHYYSTLFHELTHSTGHKSRLNRLDETKGSLRFGSELYAKEELTAELGASFLMAEAGEKINIENRAAYIQSWIQALQNDNKILVQSAAKAEKAVNYILNRTI